MSVVAAATVAWLTAILLAPALAGFAEALSAGVYLIGSLVCHQRPERSFHLGAAQLPVCARCTGLYLGAALGLVAYAALVRVRPLAWTRRAAVSALTAAAAPTAVTVATAWLGMLDPPNVWRAALAVPLGVVGGAVVGTVAADHLK